ncbi:HYC_CC_PP family protein [Flavilitoribacter nigricans]|uniref:Uncharacterized protein n=1 Tax=Flavilitoribacter nigricans (strain ATCC 23147 / DSM 23189 / NBRC 102662 / NCIMB 1420 / SS-2) TaxID=1122177 RepID=A0A2D0NB63_FLAN2|nr:hypothetical protein [Flavilitoribacter nigricans]PHN05751.1 hypothetical protein CRP01_14845 [Flavilitoribacter nigricans DSM 23189 = NBRC 102662]
MTALRNIYRILAFSLAGLLLISSINCAVDMHFCGGKLVSVSLLGKAKSCSEAESRQKRCRMSDDHEIVGTNDLQRISRTPCCQDQLLHIQLDQDQKQETVERDINSPEYFTHNFTTALLSVQPVGYYPEWNISAAHAPPDPRRDLRLFTQSFLL